MSRAARRWTACTDAGLALAITTLVLAGLATTSPRAVLAQDLPDRGREVAEAETEAPPTPERGPWWTLWSRPSPHDRLIVGMITTHLYELDEAPTNNWAIGFVYRNVVGATFITTHGPRGWVLAFERAWLEGTLGPMRTMLGFRAGLVYGYDERLFPLAEHTPILPYGQPVFLVDAGPVSLDFTYTWVVVSLTAGITLW